MSAAPQMVSSTARQLGRNWSLPNILTYARVAAVPLVAGLPVLAGRGMGAMDGARHLHRRRHHRFLRRLSGARLVAAIFARKMLDPIADKLLVAAAC